MSNVLRFPHNKLIIRPASNIAKIIRYEAFKKINENNKYYIAVEKQKINRNIRNSIKERTRSIQ